MDKTFSLTLTLEQAQTALAVIQSEIEMHECGVPDYNDVDEMLHALRRAELAERLRNAIRRADAS